MNLVVNQTSHTLSFVQKAFFGGLIFRGGSLFSEGLIIRGNFTFQNGLGLTIKTAINTKTTVKNS